LFTVAKNQIRPIEKADEYWENIEELKRINSTDFSEFNQDRITIRKFKSAVSRIVLQLKLV
ncbi:MAG: molecular chaperone Tir, partial [Mucilaginibacter sp.]